ncbi:hypothetical protein GPECTOR_24g228 [Gonium pectorale]|uniref:Apple domain-containing protein n=1 Tax=Gonium pectorale TaxID=33097 RepID=A0A150GGI9_GONPE|nr:hypothetical protein GPECTOR_24g228 [Gonium pectorale]|eukprot:KXZ48938.1 hypothetical protein GPECTOR_24g228 [Gonium pectorale]
MYANGRTCSYRANFLEGGADGGNGPDSASTVCLVRPDDGEGGYMCARSWDVSGTVLRSLRVATKAACKKACDDVGRPCSFFTFDSNRQTGGLGLVANCYLKACGHVR